MPGWQGELCQLPCLEGSYGVGCKKRCNCNGGTCHPASGKCFCEPGIKSCDDDCPAG